MPAGLVPHEHRPGVGHGRHRAIDFACGGMKLALVCFSLVALDRAALRLGDRAASAVRRPAGAAGLGGIHPGVPRHTMRGELAAPTERAHTGLPSSARRPDMTVHTIRSA